MIAALAAVLVGAWRLVSGESLIVTSTNPAEHWRVVWAKEKR